MSMRTIAILATLFTCNATSAFAAAPVFKYGEWDVNYKMEVDGMPFTMPPVTVKRKMCLDQNNFVPDNSQQDQVCTNSDQKVTGNTVTWTMRCKAQQREIEGDGKITYQGDHYEGVMKARFLSDDKTSLVVNYKYTMQGKYAGACQR